MSFFLDKPTGRFPRSELKEKKSNWSCKNSNDRFHLFPFCFVGKCPGIGKCLKSPPFLSTQMHSQEGEKDFTSQNFVFVLEFSRFPPEAEISNRQDDTNISNWFDRRTFICSPRGIWKTTVVDRLWNSCGFRRGGKGRTTSSCVSGLKSPLLFQGYTLNILAALRPWAKVF